MTVAMTPGSEAAPVNDQPADTAADLAAKLFADEPEKKEAEPQSETPAAEHEGADAPPVETPEAASEEAPKDDPRVEYERKTAELQREREEFTSRGKQAVEQERQRYREGLAQYVHLAQTLDPVIAEGLKTDWVKLAQEDPASWAAKKAVFDQRMDTLNRARQELSRHQENETLERLAYNHTKLVNAWPEWGDDVKRAQIQADLRPHMRAYGFKDHEIDEIVDYRAFLAIRDAAAYRKWTKAQSEAAKKKIAAAPKVAKPQAQKDDKSVNSKIEALLKKTPAGDARAVGELAGSLEW